MKKIIITAIVALVAVSAASAQDRGRWAIGPQIGVYTNTGAQGALLGIGAVGRYALTDNWRLQPAITAICKRGCSVDMSVDAQYLFQIAEKWSIYPQAGVGANDIGSWSAAVNVGAGADFALLRNLDLTAGMKWMVKTAKGHKNPIIISIGAMFSF